MFICDGIIFYFFLLPKSEFISKDIVPSKKQAIGNHPGSSLLIKKPIEKI
ncbi:hypothetical protein OENI_120047 [Oenococcus oeni]|nr:hypothetical protein OENI_120047 [Oenococcus oeni]SYW15653.1 hypothetical protein OENI_110051 [Oenococcus oeni]